MKKSSSRRPTLKRFRDVQEDQWCLIRGCTYRKIVSNGACRDRYGGYNAHRPGGERVLIYPWIKAEWIGERLDGRAV